MDEVAEPRGRLHVWKDREDLVRQSARDSLLLWGVLLGVVGT